VRTGVKDVGTRFGLFATGGIVLLVLGKRTLARLHLVPQQTVETMREHVQWIKNQVTANGLSKRSRR
jgi:hypothetical protein